MLSKYLKLPIVMVSLDKQSRKGVFEWLPDKSSVEGRKVLLIDDCSRFGGSMSQARDAIEVLKPSQVITAALLLTVGNNDHKYYSPARRVNHRAFYTEKTTLDLPWDFHAEGSDTDARK
jgi:hypoxanthine phosphoribosyltransferase